MSIQTRIKKVLDAQGQEVTYKQVTAQTRDSATLKKTNTFTNTKINAHVRKFKAGEFSGLVQQGDREMRIATQEISFIPNNNDRVSVAGVDFNVISVDRRTANGQNAMYILNIRGVEQ